MQIYKNVNNSGTIFTFKLHYFWTYDFLMFSRPHDSLDCRQSSIHRHNPSLSCCWWRPASIVDRSWLWCSHTISTYEIQTYKYNCI